MAWLQAAMIAAPLVLQGISTIGNIFECKKIKKAMAASNAQLDAQNAQMAASLKQQTQQSLASITGGFTGPSGISTSNHGIGRMQGGPAFLN